MLRLPRTHRKVLAWHAHNVGQIVHTNYTLGLPGKSKCDLCISTFVQVRADWVWRIQRILNHLHGLNGFCESGNETEVLCFKSLFVSEVLVFMSKLKLFTASTTASAATSSHRFKIFKT